MALGIAIVLALSSVSPIRASPPKAMLDPQALRAVERFASTWERTRAVTYRDVKQELLRDGKLSVEEVRIKFQRPARAYLFTVRPVRGREILYDRSKDPRKMKVHTGRFPDMTLSIDIFGSLATRDQHRTLSEVGFDEALRALRADILRAERDPHGEQLQWLGQGTFDRRRVDRIAFVAGQRPARRERARARESLFAFAERVEMEPYVIFVANPRLDALSDELERDHPYTIPGYRASRIEYWFDSETGMLLKQVAFDLQGKLYESYEHFDMVLNAALSDADFDPDNPAYGF
jgi:hypothetical protein